MTKRKFEFGTVVKDKITGFTGMATGYCDYMTGCDQFHVQPQIKDGSWVEGRWFDSGRLVKVSTAKVTSKSVKGIKNGADFLPPNN